MPLLTWVIRQCMYGAMPRPSPQSVRFALRVPPNVVSGSASDVVPSAAYPVRVTPVSHRFGAVSSPAGEMLSPEVRNVCARYHLSTLRYAEPAYTCVVTYSSRLFVKCI